MTRRFALLQTFVAVARARRMKEAADVLALTPGAVSQRIRQLEEIVGQPLFTMFSAIGSPEEGLQCTDLSDANGSKG